MSHFVVTGGAGFIGSHVVDRLLERGHRVTVIDDLSSGSRANIAAHPQVGLIEQRVERIGAADLPADIAGIAHLAAIPSVNRSWSAALASHHANLSATVAAIELARQKRCGKLVFASSAAVYGDSARPPIAEETQPAPISPYGLQKLASEQYLQLFARHSALDVTCLRLFNVFGPRQRTDSEYSGVVTLFMDRALRGLPLTLYGDGRQTRDFVYVKDVASAFVAALELAAQAGTCRVLNVGTGKTVTVAEIARTIAATAGWPDLPITHAAPRAGDIRDSCARIDAAARTLGFRARFDFADGLAELHNEARRVGR